MTLGEKIQKHRKEKSMSQEELAALLGVSRQAVSKWELNDTIPDTENVIQLGKILEVSLDYLLKPERETPDEGGDTVTAGNVTAGSFQAYDPSGSGTCGTGGQTKNSMCGNGDRENPGRPKKRRWGLIGWVIYLVALIIFLVVMLEKSSFAVGVMYGINITVLAVFVYIVWLLIKALKKYIQK